MDYNDSLGLHIASDLRECNKQKLDDLEYIKFTLLYAARKVGATVLSSEFHKFSPQGVTGIVSIAESHFSIHTWPEHDYAAVDIFACGSIDAYKADDIIAKRLEAKIHRRIEIQRGSPRGFYITGDLPSVSYSLK